jgi:hypothetical protein
MAIVLKEGKTYSPNSETGIDLTSNSFYGVIDSVEYNKKERLCVFFVDIYVNQTTRQLNKKFVDRVVFSFYGDSFSQIGNDGLTIPQAYIKALEILIDWMSDEE